ncbi:MAG: isoprenylcysteine carboxylmethyltransferase family protein [Propionibacteriaceae bacterium]|nr:isoprenylcysteine carboxylmethyltransferase family protein [Propionibacteriaceae bacterium]
MATTHVPPAVLAAGAFVTQHALARGRRPRGILALLGGTLAASSGVLLVASVREFRGHRTTITPVRVEQVSSLIRTGPFARTRNPIYVSMAGVLIAHAIARRSAAALIPAAAFVGLINRLQIAREEDALHEAFGAEYRAYAETVPRWVGRRSVRRN